MRPVSAAPGAAPEIPTPPTRSAGGGSPWKAEAQPPAIPLLVCAAYSVTLVVLSVMPRPPAVVPDTVAHGAATGIQAVLFYWLGASLLSPVGAMATAWLGATAFAGLTEALQYLMPPRTAELGDLASGMVGASAMLVGVLLVRRALGAARGVLRKEPLESGVPPASEGAGAAPDGGATPHLCVHCREPIRPGATRCPRCLAWQSRWAGDSQNPRLELALLVGGAAVVALLAAWLYWVGASRTSPAPRGYVAGSIAVVEVNPEPLTTHGRNSLVIRGTAKNLSTAAWRDPYLQVECFDRNGVAIETFTARAPGFVVPPSGIAAFKVVEASPLRDPAGYVRCRVEVKWAVRAD